MISNDFSGRERVIGEKGGGGGDKEKGEERRGGETQHSSFSLPACKSFQEKHEDFYKITRIKVSEAAGRVSTTSFSFRAKRIYRKNSNRD